VSDSTDPDKEAIDAAYEMAEQVIAKIAELRGYIVPGETVGAWAMIVNTQQLDSDDDIQDGYMTLYPSGRQSPHVTIGLYRLAIQMQLNPFARNDLD
jgi:hypothetical protein